VEVALLIFLEFKIVLSFKGVFPGACENIKWIVFPGACGNNAATNLCSLLIFFLFYLLFFLSFRVKW